MFSFIFLAQNNVKNFGGKVNKTKKQLDCSNCFLELTICVLF